MSPVYPIVARSGALPQLIEIEPLPVEALLEPETLLERWASCADVARLRNAYRSQNELVWAHDFVPRALVAEMNVEAEDLERVAVRKHIPLFKKSKSVAYHEISYAAPAILSMYRSPAFIALLEGITGRRLETCPGSDAHACALYYYTEEGDHIGWHYDTSHYDGERFTVLVSLYDDSRARLLGQLYKGQGGRAVVDLALATRAGTMVLFNGDRLYHSVSPIGAGERRVVLSLEYVTNGHITPWRRFIAGAKDAIAYFGWKQWVFGRRRRRRALPTTPGSSPALGI